MHRAGCASGETAAADRSIGASALSDHSDWDGLVETITATAAEKIVVTHGYATEMARWLQEEGRQAEVIPTVFREEEDDAGGESES